MGDGEQRSEEYDFPPMLSKSSLEVVAVEAVEVEVVRVVVVRGVVVMVVVDVVREVEVIRGLW